MRATLIKKFLATARASDLGKHGSVLFVALTIANFSNYIFHFVISRMLGPSEYGALGALLSVFMLISVPAGALQVVVAKRIAQARVAMEPGAVGQLLRTLLQRGALVAVYCGVLVAAWSPALSHFLRLGSLIPGFLLAIFVIPAVLTPVYGGALQGQMRFKPFAVISVVATLLRLLFGIAFVAVGWGVSGAVAASVVSQIVGVGLAMLFLRKSLASALPGSVRLIGVVGQARTAMAALAGFWAVVSVDTVLARYFLDDNRSGIYAASAVLAHAVLFFPAAIAAVAFPRFAESQGRSVKARMMLFHSTIAVFSLGLLGALFLWAFGPLAMGVLFGEAFAAGGAVVGTLGFASAFLGLSSVLMHFHLASESRALWSFGLALVLEVAGIALFHDSPLQIALVVLAVSGMLCIINLIAAYASPREIEKIPQAGHELWGTNGQTIDLTVVVPAFNPGSQFGLYLEGLLNALDLSDTTYEVISVSDGSTDGSHSLAGELESRGVRSIYYQTNRGKGFALRTGLSNARGRYIAFIDSDGDLDPTEIKSFVTIMNTYDADLVVGSKRHPLSQVDYPPIRRLMSFTYYVFVRLFFGLKIRDTQTGLKLAKREVLAQVLPRMLEKRFAFDLEMLVVAKRLGFTRFFEAPVRIDYQFSSTISGKAAWRAFLDTLAIFYRCYILRYYDRPEEIETKPGTSVMETMPSTAGEII